MANNKQLIRHLGILQRLDTIAGVTIPELMENTQKNRRTIERDLIELQEVGFPLDNNQSKGVKYWRFQSGFKDKLEVPFTVSELLSLYLAKNVLKDLKGAPFYHDLEMICQKIQLVLDENSLQYLDQIQSIFYSPKIRTKGSDKINNIVRTLIQSILNRQTIKIHFSKGKLKAIWHTIDPYLLSPYGGLYLEAWSHEDKKIETFSVLSIREVELLSRHYQSPDITMLKDRLFHSFAIIREKPFDVQIRLNKSFGAKLREWPIHPTQKLIKLKNKEILLTMHTGGFDEIISWVLAFGDKAEVLEPLKMRKKIKGILRKSMSNYQGN